MQSPLRAIYRIDARSDGPMKARQVVERELASALRGQAMYDMKLLVSELVTNGIRHGRRAPGDVITLELLANGRIRCSVTDHGPGVVAAPAPGHGAAGWGWKLVEALADRWGCTSSEDGTQVWFETPELHAA
jgi:anti-sigma regulatory factor (Ser/Thr protein kinase)